MSCQSGAVTLKLSVCLQGGRNQAEEWRVSDSPESVVPACVVMS